MWCSLVVGCIENFNVPIRKETATSLSHGCHGKGKPEHLMSLWRQQRRNINMDLFFLFVCLFTNFDKKVNIFVFPKSNTGIVIEVVLRIRIRMQSLQHQNNV